MIISHKYKYIFIKGFKVAGTSVEMYLEKFVGKKDIIGAREDFSDTPEAELPEYYNHMPLNLIKSKLSREAWKEYFKFCICRNPWDTAVSLYCFKSKSMPNKYENFEDFINKTKDSMINFSSFYSPLEDVDFFIRFENLYPDLMEVCAKLGIPYEESSIPMAKTEFRNRNKHYSTYYNGKTKKIIERECAEDIKHFGYRFESG